jgi:hypothetical protein
MPIVNVITIEAGSFTQGLAVLGKVDAAKASHVTITLPVIWVRVIHHASQDIRLVILPLTCGICIDEVMGTCWCDTRPTIGIILI